MIIVVYYDTYQPINNRNLDIPRQLKVVGRVRFDKVEKFVLKLMKRSRRKAVVLSLHRKKDTNDATDDDDNATATDAYAQFGKWYRGKLS